MMNNDQSLRRRSAPGGLRARWTALLAVVSACAGPSGPTTSPTPDAAPDAVASPDVGAVDAGVEVTPPPEDAATEVTSPAGGTCPTCPDDDLCRPDRGECVGAGVVRCAPTCAAGTVCDLSATCRRPTCAPRDRFPARALKLTALTIPTDGGCGGASVTALGRLAARLSVVATLLEDAVRSDRATLLLEPTGFSEAGGVGQLTWLFGARAADSLRCDPTVPEAFCTYTASPDCWDAATPGDGPCAPWLTSRAAFTPAASPGEGRLAGGGMTSEVLGTAGDLMQFAIPTGDGGQVLLQLHAPVLEAQATVDPSHPAAVGAPGFVGVSGRLCGAVPLASLRAALSALPADLVSAVGGLANAEALLADNLVPDVDLDGDGTFDAASAALAFTGTRARLSGLSPR
jgi:hypothetical protein